MLDKYVVELTREEMLIEYKNNPSIELRNEIHSKYMYVARAISRKYAYRGIDYDDIEQVASIALLKAIERYDIKRGVKLQSYAAPTIIGEIKNYFRSNTSNVKVPIRSVEAIRKIKVQVSKLTINLERSPTITEIAEATNLSDEYVLEMLDMAQNSNTLSFDASFNNEDAGSLNDIIGKVDEGYRKVENNEFLEKVLSNLDKKDKFIIYQRYYKNKSQREIAKVLNVSQMYVSRAEQRIIKKMRLLI